MADVVDLFPNGSPRDQLLAQLQDLRAQIAQLDLEEPEDMDSEAYELWGERHEDLEDQVDELLEQLDLL
jgi:ribosomal protein L29